MKKTKFIQSISLKPKLELKIKYVWKFRTLAAFVSSKIATGDVKGVYLSQWNASKLRT